MNKQNKEVTKQRELFLCMTLKVKPSLSNEKDQKIMHSHP